MKPLVRSLTKRAVVGFKQPSPSTPPKVHEKQQTGATAAQLTSYLAAGPGCNTAQ